MVVHLFALQGLVQAPCCAEARAGASWTMWHIHQQLALLLPFKPAFPDRWCCWTVLSKKSANTTSTDSGRGARFRQMKAEQAAKKVANTAGQVRGGIIMLGVCAR